MSKCKYLNEFYYKYTFGSLVLNRSYSIFGTNYSYVLKKGTSYLSEVTVQKLLVTVTKLLRKKFWRIF